MLNNKNTPQNKINESLFLTQIEVRELSGSKQRSKQMDWLTCNKYPFEVNNANQILVLRTYVYHRFTNNILENH